MIENTPEVAPEIRIKRLKYRSWHRGCKETDVILGYFADSHLEVFNPGQLDLFEKLLEEQDADIWKWIVGKEVPSNLDYLPILDILKKYGTENKNTM